MVAVSKMKVNMIHTFKKWYKCHCYGWKNNARVTESKQYGNNNDFIYLHAY